MLREVGSVDQSSSGRQNLTALNKNVYENYENKTYIYILKVNMSASRHFFKFSIRTLNPGSVD